MAQGFSLRLCRTRGFAPAKSPSRVQSLLGPLRSAVGVNRQKQRGWRGRGRRTSLSTEGVRRFLATRSLPRAPRGPGGRRARSLGSARSPFSDGGAGASVGEAHGPGEVTAPVHPRAPRTVRRGEGCGQAGRGRARGACVGGTSPVSGRGARGAGRGPIGAGGGARTKEGRKGGAEGPRVGRGARGGRGM